MILILIHLDSIHRADNFTAFTAQAIVAYYLGFAIITHTQNLRWAALDTFTATYADFWIYGYYIHLSSTSSNYKIALISSTTPTSTDHVQKTRAGKTAKIGCCKQESLQATYLQEPIHT